MYIKNISQILNLKGDERVNLSKGSHISGKILSLSAGKGVVQLANGLMLPTVFLVDENLIENKSYRFKVKEYGEDKIVLEVSNKEATDENKKTDINRILEKLNLTKSEGQEIISKLMKFSMPARDETILNIHNNFNFIKDLRSLSTSELLSLISNITGKTLDETSMEFLSIKNALNSIKNVDIDFLTFLEQNKIPATFDNILKVNDFLKNPLLINEFMDNVTTSNSDKILNNSNLMNLDDESLTNLCKDLNLSKESLKGVLTYIKENNVSISNISEKDAKNLLTIMQNNTTNTQNSLDKLTTALKSISLLSSLPFNDDSLCKDISITMKNLHDVKIDTSTIKELSLMLRENPTFSSIIKSINCDSVDFLKLCENITKNPKLTENSPEVLLLKEFSKGNLDEIFSLKYAKADKLESMILKALTTDFFEKESFNGKLSSINTTLANIKENPDILSKLSPQILQLLNDNIDITKYLSNNYTLFNFNYLNKQELYKNNIIIKNKYASKYVDINDVKLYISVDSNNMGLIEGYVSKKFNDITLSLKAGNNHISRIKENISRLENNLTKMGYKIITISIEPSLESINLISLSDFFNDSTYSDLDVKV